MKSISLNIILKEFIDIFNTLEFKAESSSKRFNKKSAGLSEIEIISYIEEKMPEYELWRKDLMGHLGSIGRKLELSEKSITKEFIVYSNATRLKSFMPFVQTKKF